MTLNPHFGKNPLKNVDCEAIYLLCINRYHTSALVQPIPLQPSLHRTTCDVYFKGILTWKGITSAMERADLDSLLCDKQDRVYFTRSDGHLIYLQFCEYFLRV